MRRTTPFLFLLGFFLIQSPGTATSRDESACERLYAEFLEKAKRALVDNKPADAIMFLSEAAAAAGSCANEQKPPRDHSRQSTLA
jgi:hypothetical protein